MFSANFKHYVGGRSAKKSEQRHFFVDFYPIKELPYFLTM